MEPFYRDGITIITLSTIILGCLGMSLKLIFDICAINRAVAYETELTPDIIPNDTV